MAGRVGGMGKVGDWWGEGRGLEELEGVRGLGGGAGNGRGWGEWEE